ncbi:hypothetical protein BFJ69_g6432 [Fusarium oxysporum]|uniref:Uncharacterized protein n=1 Tax=Fusarium oxysporum TaxID=5507 RepID=A0A420NA84_FUSOX|nr:hypothetical protein BFJ69_g6432 [Fusarium oxysporum]
MLKPETRLEWAFVGITAAQAIIIISLQTVILVEYLDWVNPVVYQVPVSYVTPVASAVSIISFGFQAVLSVDSCRIKNKVQLWTQGILNICFSIATGMEYFQVKDATDRMFHIAAIVYLVTRLIVLTGDGLLASTLMKEEMLLFATFALVFTTISIAFAVLCVFNFGKGLKPLLQGQGTNNIPTSTSALELNPRHLSIRTMDSERMSKRFDID